MALSVALSTQHFWKFLSRKFPCFRELSVPFPLECDSRERLVSNGGGVNMAAIKHNLQRDLFKPSEERLYAVVSVTKAGKKKKASFLCVAGMHSV